MYILIPKYIHNILYLMLHMCCDCSTVVSDSCDVCCKGRAPSCGAVAVRTRSRCTSQGRSESHSAEVLYILTIEYSIALMH